MSMSLGLNISHSSIPVHTLVLEVAQAPEHLHLLPHWAVC
jgi:hypothetical protein